MTLADIRLALRITETAYDSELEALAEAGMEDLRLAGVLVPGMGSLDAITAQAVKTYVRLHFGQPADYDRLARSYDTQKAQLMSATGHTDWGGAEA